MTRANRYTPAVPRHALLFLAGAVWIGVGTMLLLLAFTWLAQSHGAHTYVLVGAGVALALLAHHFGFLRIVDRNVGRILARDGKRCVFSFVPWRSYLLIAGMMGMGVVLRHSALPKHYLAVLYIGMGLALLLSSVRYIRVFAGEIRGRPAA